MNVELAREFLLGLPHVVETRQWGDNLVFWVGDKAIGGKMFALLDLDGTGSGGTAAKGVRGVISFAAGAEGFADLVEREGIFPAPYMARIFWVAAERWTALRDREWRELLTAAHGMVAASLPKKILAILQLPKAEQERLVAERKAVLGDRKKLPAKRTRS